MATTIRPCPDTRPDIWLTPSRTVATPLRLAFRDGFNAVETELTADEARDLALGLLKAYVHMENGA